MNCVMRHQLRVMDIELNIFKAQCPHSSDEDNNTQLCPAVGRSFTNKDLATTALPFSCASTRKIIKVGLMVCHKEVSVQDITCVSLYLDFLLLYCFLHPSFPPLLLTCAREAQQERETWDHQALGQASWRSCAGCLNVLKLELRPCIRRPGFKATRSHS